MFTEPEGLESIAKIAEVYRTTDLRERLARHHGANVDVAFWGWNGVWLDPGFRAWNLEEFLPGIQVPILILQGDRDEYGTWHQVEAIERQAGGAGADSELRAFAAPGAGGGGSGDDDKVYRAVAYNLLISRLCTPTGWILKTC